MGLFDSAVSAVVNQATDAVHQAVVGAVGSVLGNVPEPLRPLATGIAGGLLSKVDLGSILGKIPTIGAVSDQLSTPEANKAYEIALSVALPVASEAIGIPAPVGAGVAALAGSEIEASRSGRALSNDALKSAAEQAAVAAAISAATAGVGPLIGEAVGGTGGTAADVVGGSDAGFAAGAGEGILTALGKRAGAVGAKEAATTPFARQLEDEAARSVLSTLGISLGGH